MNLDTIEVTPEECERKIAEYGRVLTSERSVEDTAILGAYRAAKRGLPLLHLSAAIHAGGYFDDGLPRLAIARADTTECFLQTSDRWSEPTRTLVFGDSRFADVRGAIVGKHGVVVECPRPSSTTNERRAGRTIVPLVPPNLRPRRPRISRFHILWEVEAWDDTPPRDPALLRHVRGDLWSVVAVWDLTDLERAVLAQRG